MPDLRVDAIKAKIDTGARTSALHAYSSSRFGAAARALAPLRVAADAAERRLKVICEARAVDQRTVRNSGGGVEKRYIITTLLKLGEESWPIELALANRDQMGFRMLLGRTALESRALIEPGRSFLLGGRPARLRRRRTPSSSSGKSLP